MSAQSAQGLRCPRARTVWLGPSMSAHPRSLLRAFDIRASAHSVQGLLYPITDSLSIVEYITWENAPSDEFGPSKDAVRTAHALICLPWALIIRFISYDVSHICEIANTQKLRGLYLDVLLSVIVRIWLGNSGSFAGVKLQYFERWQKQKSRPAAHAHSFDKVLKWFALTIHEVVLNLLHMSHRGDV